MLLFKYNGTDNIEELIATRLQAKRDQTDLDDIVKELRLQLDKRDTDFKVLNAVLSKKQEDLVFAYEQIKETKEWAVEQLQELKGSASDQVIQLEEKIDRLEKAAESERKGLEFQLTQRNAENKELQRELDSEKARNANLMKSTTDLSKRVELDLEAKLYRLEDILGHVSDLGGVKAGKKDKLNDDKRRRRPDEQIDGDMHSVDTFDSDFDAALKSDQKKLPKENVMPSPRKQSAKVHAGRPRAKVRTPYTAFEKHMYNKDGDDDEDSVRGEIRRPPLREELQFEAFYHGEQKPFEKLDKMKFDEEEGMRTRMTPREVETMMGTNSQNTTKPNRIMI